MAKARKKKPVTLAKVATGASSLPSHVVKVEDPFALKPGETIEVRRRLTPLVGLCKRGKIDNSQKSAGEIFAKYYANAELGGAKAIDYTREHVEGGGALQTLTETQQEAIEWLRRIARHPGVGEQGFRVLTAVCGDEKNIRMYASEWSMKSGGGYGISRRLHSAEGYVLHRLVEALDCLTKLTDTVAQGPERGRMKSEHGDNLGIGGGEYEINRLGDLVLRKRA
jgi:hypothetical protein